MLMRRQLAYLSTGRALAKARSARCESCSKTATTKRSASMCRWRRCTRRNPLPATSEFRSLEATFLALTLIPLAAATRLLARSNEEIGEVLLHQSRAGGSGKCLQVGSLLRRKSKSVLQGLGAQRSAGFGLDSDRAKACCRECAGRLGQHDRHLSRTDSAAPRISQVRKIACGSMAVAAQPCRRCGDPIRHRIQGPDARVTFWCQTCQPMPDGSDDRWLKRRDARQWISSRSCPVRRSFAGCCGGQLGDRRYLLARCPS